MSALLKIHSHDGIAGIKQCKKYGKVCICSAVRLNIDMLRFEKLLSSVTGDFFNNIDALTAAVIPL